MISNSQSDVARAGQQNPPPEEASEARKPVKTAGKHLHNEITYRGFDLFINSAFGVGMAYFTTRTEFGKRYFQKPITNTFTKILTPILKTPSKIAEGARWGSMFVSIILGGTAIIPPMVVLEKKENKIALIKWFDELIYGKERVANDPKFQECLDSINDEPKKNFWTGMAARVAVLVPELLVTIHPDVNKRMIKYLYNPIAKGSKAIAEGIGIKPKGLMQRGAMEIADGDVSKAASFVSDWDFIHRTIGFDAGLTIIYSFAHEFTYKAFAEIWHHHNHGNHDTPAEVIPVHAVVENMEVAPSHDTRKWSRKIASKGTDFTERLALTEGNAQLERI